MQVIDNTLTIKPVAVTDLPQGTVFKAVNSSIWMVLQASRAVCLATGNSSRQPGDVRDIRDDNYYYPFSKIQVLEAVLHVTI
ncbi:hypothetical protein BF2512_21 [Dickeya phage BF25/12]|uniref:Uncharacterized protein n=1 Tax=Dickeya phage BF25/12 TaxID=1698708 RepID=A0A219MH14_9CAUD|nr:hypothetical protein HOR10_gp21 [Dickeya phage BF25/12]ALA46478.1 hypothetical protein BF2512_21 [Dickeya phage BF25/12]